MTFIPPPIKITDPARFCVNCEHSFRTLPLGEHYCRVSPRGHNLVTGDAMFSFCDIERADADKCGPLGKNFVRRVAP